MRTPHTKGFTLIELLVVIAIIGVLASIVLAAVNSATKAAKNAGDVAEVREFQIAMESYFNSNGGYPGAASCNSTTPCCLSTTCQWSNLSVNPLPLPDIKNVAPSEQLATAGATYQGVMYKCLNVDTYGNCSQGEIVIPYRGSTCPQGYYSLSSGGTNSLCARYVPDTAGTGSSETDL
jgi:prepilin-type N-terminal cleavage/methylation domain-containing protein